MINQLCVHATMILMCGKWGVLKIAWTTLYAVFSWIKLNLLLCVFKDQVLQPVFNPFTPVGFRIDK